MANQGLTQKLRKRRAVAVSRRKSLFFKQFELSGASEGPRELSGNPTATEELQDKRLCFDSVARGTAVS
jgi:hypothetical protein